MKVPVIASDEGAKQSLNLFELTLEITPRNDRNMPKLRVFVQELFSYWS